MSRKIRIENKIKEELSPSFIKVVDVSSQHHEHLPDNSGETHFEITVQSSRFKELSKVKCHRIIYNLLSEEFDNGLHAVSIVTNT